MSNNNNISSSTLPFAEPIHKSVSLGSEVFFLPSQSSDIISGGSHLFQMIKSITLSSVIEIGGSDTQRTVTFTNINHKFLVKKIMMEQLFK